MVYDIYENNHLRKASESTVCASRRGRLCLCIITRNVDNCLSCRLVVCWIIKIEVQQNGFISSFYKCGDAAPAQFSHHKPPPQAATHTHYVRLLLKLIEINALRGVFCWLMLHFCFSFVCKKMTNAWNYVIIIFLLKNIFCFFAQRTFFQIKISENFNFRNLFN